MVEGQEGAVLIVMTSGAFSVPPPNTPAPTKFQKRRADYVGIRETVFEFPIVLDQLPLPDRLQDQQAPMAAPR